MDARQRAVVDALRETTEHANSRTQAALAELGLAPAYRAGAAVGGPFVPLAEAALTPEDNLALLKDALARHRQLESVTARLPLRQPVEGPLDVTSSFGARRDPFYGRLALHTGIDLREDYGSAVRAVAAGTVTIAGPESGYGTLVEIDHGNGYATRYAHLSTVSVAVGEKVGRRRHDRPGRHHRPLHRAAPALRGPHRRRAGRSGTLPQARHCDRGRVNQPWDALLRKVCQSSSEP